MSQFLSGVEYDKTTGTEILYMYMFKFNYTLSLSLYISMLQTRVRFNTLAVHAKECN